MIEWDLDQSIVLCSDGLTNTVEESTIHSVVNENLLLEEKVERLISLANSAGGEDNISIIIVQNK